MNGYCLHHEAIEQMIADHKRNIDNLWDKHDEAVKEMGKIRLQIAYIVGGITVCGWFVNAMMLWFGGHH